MPPLCFRCGRTTGPKSKNAREGIETHAEAAGLYQALTGPKSKNAREGIETQPCGRRWSSGRLVRKAKMPARALKQLNAHVDAVRLVPRPKSKNAREGIETNNVSQRFCKLLCVSEKQKCPRGH